VTAAVHLASSIARDYKARVVLAHIDALPTIKPIRERWSATGRNDTSTYSPAAAHLPRQTFNASFRDMNGNLQPNYKNNSEYNSEPN
jgi:hypothetical protein